MSRHGYTDDLTLSELNLYRGTVLRSIRGKRGQAFLRQLAEAMDRMPERRLISGNLVDTAGQCCTLGVVVKARGLDVRGIDIGDPDWVGALLGISRQMAAEIEYENDDGDWRDRTETDEERWKRMRAWVSLHLTGE